VTVMASRVRRLTWAPEDVQLSSPSDMLSKSSAGKASKYDLADLPATGGKTVAPLASGGVVKVGKEGYIHGYICVRPPCGPVYTEATHDTKTGKIYHDGAVIGRQLKKEPGDMGYSAAYLKPDGSKVKLSGYATRAESALAVAQYRDVSVMHDEATGGVKTALASAQAALEAGDKDAAARSLGEAAATVRAGGDDGMASHVDHVRSVLAGEGAVEPKALSSAATPAGDLLRTSGQLWQTDEGTAQLPEAQKDAVARVWYSDAFNDANSHLRSGGAPTSDMTDFTDAINSAKPFQSDVMLYRGVAGGDRVFGPAGSAVGKDITDPGFMSTTPDEKLARNYGGSSFGEGRTVLVLHAPAGSRALKADDDIISRSVGRGRFSSADEAKEYTFAPGTSYRVTSDETTPGGTRVLHADITPAPKRAAVSEVVKPDDSHLNGFEIADKMNDEPSYVPSDEAHQKLATDHAKVTADWQHMTYSDKGYFQKQADVQTLAKAVDESKNRRQLAAATAAAAAARGKSLDTSMLTGSMDDYLPAADAAEWRGLVSDSHLSFPNPKDEPWGEHGSPGYEKAYRLDRLKYTAAQAMMEKAGVPPEAAEAIAGWPSMETKDRYMWSGDSLFTTMETTANNWSSTGDNASLVSTLYDRSRAMSAPPDVRASDFTRHQKEIPGGSFGSSWAWDDESPEAAKRREDASAYWGVRAQQHYTQQVLDSMPKRAQQEQIPVARMIYGAQASALRNAVSSGQGWKVATRSLSSWAEPSPRAAKSVERYITGDMWHSGVMGQDPIWLAQKVSPDQVFMHWRGEGELRNGVKVLGEIVVPDSDVTNATAGVNDSLAAALAAVSSSVPVAVPGSEVTSE
jgi:hypothetical protein